jgi:hypothetical protein
VLSNKHKFAAWSNEAEMEAQGALSTVPRKSLEVSPRLVLAGLFTDRQQYALAREPLEKLVQDNAIRTDRERGDGLCPTGRHRLLLKPPKPPNTRLSSTHRLKIIESWQRTSASTGAEVLLGQPL